MIVKMMKYNIVLFSEERERFVERLRELGMVDITTSGWEPSEGDRELVSAIESRTKALAALELFAESDDYVEGSKAEFEKGKAFEAYQSAQATIAAAKGENCSCSDQTIELDTKHFHTPEAFCCAYTFEYIQEFLEKILTNLFQNRSVMPATFGPTQNEYFSSRFLCISRIPKLTPVPTSAPTNTSVK